MLRSLLEERFKLATRRETKELAIHALVVAKNGPKFHALKADEGPCWQGCAGAPGKTNHLRQKDLPSLATFLTRLGSCFLMSARLEGQGNDPSGPTLTAASAADPESTISAISARPRKPSPKPVHSTSEFIFRPFPAHFEALSLPPIRPARKTTASLKSRLLWQLLNKPRPTA
jgi:hypothetical protein